MPKATKTAQKKVLPPAPYTLPGQAAPAAGKAEKKAPAPSRFAALFEKRNKICGIGGDIAPQRDVTHFVKWPLYIRLQRQKKVLNNRLKVPPSIAQFSNTLERNLATTLFKLLNKYKPETAAEKKLRIKKEAEAKAAGQAPVATAKPSNVKFGLKHVTSLVESKKASLVVIAHDVDPIELVMWLPALCKQQDIPYCIVKGKARLGCRSLA
eukprot:TRINITY_DN165_c0_g1_i3.p1 TRINITY_DN165_c0_g1~~TRINITY_DN165_c0_g1_i3.p1  ORF type:complete len:210 (+),score=133.55 TRINITY_DN165_c0_g1_i3:65-694(+)